MSESTPPRKRRLWLKILLGFVGMVALSLVLIVLARNVLLERVIERFGSQASGKQIEVDGVSIGRTLEIASLKVTDPAHPEQPLAQITGLSAALDVGDGYTLISDQVTVKKAEIHWVETGPAGESTVATPEASSPKPRAPRRKGGDDDYMPRAVLVEELIVTTESPRGNVTLGPVKVEARLKPAAQMLVEITGSPRVQASGGGLPSPIDATGDVNVKVSREKRDYNIDLKANLPGLLALDLSGHGASSGSGGEGLIEVRSGTAEGAIWAQAASAVLGVPVAFERIELTPGTLEVNASLLGVIFKQASFALKSPRMQLGPPSALWLDAPVQLSITPGRIDLAGPGDGSVRAQLELHAGDVVAHFLPVSVLPAKGEATVDPITPAALAKSFPKAAMALPGLAKVKTLDIKATLSASALGVDAATVLATAKVKNSDTPLTTEVTYKRNAKGSVALVSRYGDANAMEVPALSFGDLATPVAYNFKADLSEFGGLVGLEGWGGMLEAKGTLSTNSGTPGGDIEITATNLVSDSFSMPLDVPLTVKSSFQLNGLEVALNGFSADMADGTAIHFKNGSVGMTLLGTPSFLANELTLALPASFLAAQGYLESGTGMVSLKATRFTMSGDAVETSLEYTLALDAMALPEHVAAASKLTGVGHVGLSGGKLSAEGTLAAEKILIAGAALENASTTLHSDGTTLVLDPLRGRLFGGAFAGTLRVEPFEENYPLTLEARLEGGTLDRFSEEVQPPNVNLGGTVTGDVLVGLRGEVFTALNVDLEAANGLTINRELVAQLLMSQQMSVATGSKTVGKVLDKIVGGDEQRPFDSAALKLGLSEGRITGDVTLASKALNLTVDLKADPGAVWEAIKSRGQVSFGDIAAQ